MLQAMHASNARKQCRYETNVTNGLRSRLSYRDLLTFRNARAHIRKFPLDPEPTDLSATRKRADMEAAK